MQLGSSDNDERGAGGWLWSRRSGVNVPFFCARTCGVLGGEYSSTDDEDPKSDAENSLGGLEPRVAAMDGDEGGSGDLVKYTTLAKDPPICKTS